MREREREGKRERKERTYAGERVREKAHWLLLLYVFSSTWACPMQIGLSQECCLFCPKFSLWSLDLPCLLATAILDSFSLFYLPNTSICLILCRPLSSCLQSFPAAVSFPVSWLPFSNSEVTNQWYSNSGLCVCPCVYFHWRSLFPHMVLLLSSVFFVFHLDLRTSFGFTYRIGLVVMNSASFCLSGNVSVKVEVVPQTCPAVHHLMDYSQPGASVCGILQAKILGWVAIPFSRGSAWYRISCFAGRFFTIWATGEAPEAMCLFLFFWKALLPGIGFLLDSCIKQGFPEKKNQ